MGVLATVLLLLVVKEPSRGNQVELKPSTQPSYGINGVSKTYEVDSEDGETEFSKDENPKSVVTSPTGSRAREGLLGGESGPKEVAKSLLKPSVLMLAFAACLRHTGEFVSG